MKSRWFRLYYRVKSWRNYVQGKVSLKLRSRRCPLCLEDNQLFYAHSLFAYYLQCPSCNLIYVGNQPSPKRVFKFYRSPGFLIGRTSFFADHAKAEDRQAWEHHKRLTFEALGACLTPQGDGNRLLEVGCGEGWLLPLFRDLGWEPMGIELNPIWVQGLVNQGFAIKSEPLEQVELGTQRIDRILLFHVLEHLIDPFFGLKKLRQACSPTGDLILETPLSVNFESVDHLYFFNGMNLRLLLDKSGFQVVGEYEYQDAWHPEFRNLALRAVVKDK